MLNVLDDAKKRGHYRLESVNSVGQLWYLCCGKSASAISFRAILNLLTMSSPDSVCCVRNTFGV